MNDWHWKEESALWFQIRKADGIEVKSKQNAVFRRLSLYNIYDLLRFVFVVINFSGIHEKSQIYVMEELFAFANVIR